MTKAAHMAAVLEDGTPYIPFTKGTELRNDLEYLSNGTKDAPSIEFPGFPHLRIGDNEEVFRHLSNELFNSQLEQLAGRLWMMSKQSSDNISPLHRQYVKGRSIVLTEEIKLHLIWTEEKIFIKPLPSVLLCHAFWTQLLHPNGVIRGDRTLPADEKVELERLQSWALGFLRTYHHLIRHESDLFIAQRENLLPESVSWRDWCFFSRDLRSIPDDKVCLRYRFGEIRLARLNFYSTVLRPWTLGTSPYMRVSREYGAYFARFYAPLLFVFAVLSVVLGAIQVKLGVSQIQVDGSSWFAEHVFLSFSNWFSIVILVLLAILCAVLLLLLIYKHGKEWWYAVKDRQRKRKEALKALNNSSG